MYLKMLACMTALFALTCNATVQGDARHEKRDKVEKYNRACQAVAASSSSSANCLSIVQDLRSLLTHSEALKVYQSMPTRCLLKSPQYTKLSARYYCAAFESELIYIIRNADRLSDCKFFGPLAFTPQGAAPPSWTVCKERSHYGKFKRQIRRFDLVPSHRANETIALGRAKTTPDRYERRQREIIAKGTY